MFWINIPLGVLAILAAVFFLRLPKKVQTSRPLADYSGMALIAVATTAMVLVGTWGGAKYDWTSVQILALIAIMVVGAVLFVFVERRAKEPLIPMWLFKDRNFALTTVASLIIGIAMFGAIGYMPTYLQMVTGADATTAGFLMIPMMGALLVTSIVTGQYVSRTGKYKAAPIIGTVIVTGGLVLLSTIRVVTPTPMICIYLGVLGIGLGMSMQLLTLIVQNSFPLRVVGTATAANNYFRQVGATLGSAVVGSVFASRLTSLILEKLPAGAGPSDGAQSLTPALVRAMPDALRMPIIESYNEALVPIFLGIAPLALIAAVILCFLHEKPLATTLDIDPEAELSSGGTVS